MPKYDVRQLDICVSGDGDWVVNNSISIGEITIQPTMTDPDIFDELWIHVGIHFRQEDVELREVGDDSLFEIASRATGIPYFSLHKVEG